MKDVLFASELKSHEIRSMLSTLTKLLRENEYKDLAKEIEELSREHRDKLKDLVDSYIDSHYEDIEYDKTQADELIELVEKIISKLEEVSKRAKLGEG
ncbi:HEPN domain-containing protein [Sulfurisphaera javensis]|uniref:HEPN domain-containing protein n=1 Tax=Sulfurisphaera javensis TaxID=2049879 RepID=UPI0034E8A61E